MVTAGSGCGVRRVSFILLALCFALAGPLPGRTAVYGDAAPATVTDFVGTWQATININGVAVPFVWIVAGDQFTTFVQGQQIPVAVGKFEVANGRWKTTPTTLPPDEGPFRFIDADTISMTGKAGQEVVWKRLKAQLVQPPPGIGNVAPPAVPEAAASLDDFTQLRAQAKAVAGRWEAGAQLFRVDTWGAYAGSRFRPTGARFLFFSPKANGAGLEVRVENNAMNSAAYALDLAAAPQALADTAMAPEDALRRLWDLAPTVRADQVYLQLLQPGVEKPTAVQGDREATSYPIQSFLQNFPVPMRDSEKNAPRDRAVWRMAAVRDHDVIMDRAYGTFVYIDATSGAALSKRQPANGVQIYMRHQLSPPSPIGPYVFAEGDIVLDSPVEQVGTFDVLAVRQKAESMILGLRLMVRDGRRDNEIRAAIDKFVSWWGRVEQVRQQDAGNGVRLLEQAARQEPGNIARQVALFKRYVDEIEKEKKQALGSDVVVRIGGPRNNKSEFWLGKQFEVTEEALGTRNQTHMVLDTHTVEWIYKMQDPPNTHLFSKYFRPAVGVLQAVRALGKEDYEMQRQITRLNWLIGGNGAAVPQDNEVNPLDPLQLMAYAEYNRVKGSENMLAAARLRLPKSWSNTSRRDLGNGTVEVTTTTYTRPPTADELAAADRLDTIAKQEDAPRVSQLQDLALKLQPPDARIYYMWTRVEAVFYDAQLSDRIAVRGLLIDPGCAELHAARLIAWMTSPKVNQGEEYCVEIFSQPYTAANLVGGGKLAESDPWAAYFLSLQRMRIAPDDIGSHAILTSVMARFNGLKINNQEAMPDSEEQRQRELGVGAAMMMRLLDHPNEWQKGVPKGMPATRENLVRNTVNLLSLRGEALASLKRSAEAKVCFEKVLALDPSNEAARRAMQ